MTTEDGKNIAENTVISQPQSISVIPGAPGSGAVTIRNLEDTLEDAAFVGRLTVEAFRSKYVHATSEGSIPDVIRAITMEHRGQDPIFYERKFVAEYEGRLVGIIYLVINGDPSPRENSDAYNVFGCCDVCGLKCMDLGEESIEDLKEDECFIDQVVVEEKYRGMGIGKTLLERADYEARQHGCKKNVLLVGSNNWAIRLYQRQGYTLKNRWWRCGWLWCTLGVCDKFVRINAKGIDFTSCNATAETCIHVPGYSQ